MRTHSLFPSPAALGLAGLFLAPALSAQLAFGPQQVIVTSPNSLARVVAADVDGDGDEDVIYGSTSGRVERLLNLGAGSYSQYYGITSSRGDTFLVCDVDNDGDLDVISADSGVDNIGWHANDGSGFFGLRQIITSACNPESLQWLDIDDDGQINDLAYTTCTGTKWITYNPNGTFAGPYDVTSNVSATDQRVVFADVDSDGDPDAIIAQFNPASGGSSSFSSFSLYINGGAGNFTYFQTLATGSQSASLVSAGDIDGDSDADVIFYDSGALQWLANDGAGNFGGPNLIGSAQSTAHIVDIDLDGDLDVLAVTNGQTAEVSYYANQGGGTFAPKQVITSNLPTVTSLFAADMDGDGDLDVLATSLTNQTVVVYENIPPVPSEVLGAGCAGLSLSGNPMRLNSSWDLQLDGVSATSPLSVFFVGSAALEPGVPLTSRPPFAAQQPVTSAGGFVRAVHTADLDGDGDEEVLTASSTLNRIAYYDNLGAGAFGPQQTIASAFQVQPSALDTADVDGDGDLDVLCASSTDNKVAWYENTAGGSWLYHQITTAALATGDVHAADLDGDGDVDALFPSFLDDKILWCANDGAGNFGAPQTITTATAGAQGVHAADMDGDGDLDVLSASNFDNKIAWYENLGGGAFGPQQIVWSALVSATDVYAEDLDGDGDLDVLSASYGGDNLAWYENLGGVGSVSFGPLQLISNAADGAQRAFATDLDGDGDVDVVSTSTVDNKLAYYTNLGGGAFGPQQVLATISAGPSGLAVTDLTGDGAADIVTSSLLGQVTYFPAGGPACTAYTIPDLGFFLQPVVAGASTWSLAVPNNPSLVGAQLTVQGTAASADPTAWNGRALSNGLRGTVGQ